MWSLWIKKKFGRIAKVNFAGVEICTNKFAELILTYEEITHVQFLFY